MKQATTNYPDDMNYEFLDNQEPCSDCKDVRDDIDNIVDDAKTIKLKIMMLERKIQKSAWGSTKCIEDADAVCEMLDEMVHGQLEANITAVNNCCGCDNYEIDLTVDPVTDWRPI
ncbi:MAG: hypothetical protein AAGA64_16595 [Bacteroidota bacterium]